jgi:hypothetical protein
MDYKLKKKLLTTEMGFWRRAVRATRLLEVKKRMIREKMLATQFWEEQKIIC